MDHAKLYLEKHGIQQLFESIMTGLMYQRPDDHILFIEQCLQKIKETKPESIKWNLFVEPKKKKSGGALPPIEKKKEEEKAEEKAASEAKTADEEATFAAVEPEVPADEPAAEEEPAAAEPEPAAAEPEAEPTAAEPEAEPASEPAADAIEIADPDAAVVDKNIVFVLGGPGSGKGTQCEKIVHQYGFAHFSAGDLLRAEVESGSERGEMISNIMKNGELVPVEVTMGLLKDAILNAGDAPGVLIDGFPRAVDQGQEFERLVCQCQFILFFECSEETMEARLLKRGETSGREDDNAETIRKRFTTFVEKSLPVIDYYGEKVRKISSEQEPDAVFGDVTKALEEFGYAPKDSAPEAAEEPAADPVDAPAASEEAAGSDDLSEARIVFVLGGPGSGKGTQCDRIKAKYGFAHFSAGDLLREEVEKKTERGVMIDEMMKEGTLVPQEITIELLKDAIKSCDSKKGVLVDGFPRAVDQGEDFEKNVCTSKMVLFFECSEEVMTERLLKRGETSGRADDNIETIKKRFTTFLEKSLPVIEVYADKTEKINSERDPGEVFADVCTALEKYGFSASESEDSPAEEAPAEEAPTEEAPAEEAPAEEAPAEEDQAEEAPAEEAPAEEAPAEEAPAEEAPAEEAPTEDAPAEDAPAEEAPAEEAPAEEAPAEDAPAEEAPAEEAPAEEAPAEDAPAEDAPAEDAPAEDAPTEEAPAEEAPAEDAPAEDAPAEDAPAEEAPAEEAPAEEAPAEEAPAEETPAEEAPAEEAPAEEAPAEDAPAEDAPAEEAPAEDAPAEEAPAEDAPAEDAPAEEAPAEDAPAEEAPAEEAPAEEAAAEEAPAEEAAE
eukprot:Nk52_evm20s16 gene=Nk52_evmTU20s16